MNPTPRQMRDTLRLWASGVSVVTTTQGTHRYGMTVSAFNSLSLEPPLIIVCLLKDTQVGSTIPEAGVFAVSILDSTQAYLSDRFAGRIPLVDDEDRFDGVSVVEASTGAPVLADALAWLDCRVYAVHDGGTHWIVAGEVVATGQRQDNLSPLIYFDRDYRELAHQEERL